MWEFVLFSVGLVGLWVGTEFVVPATVSLGQRRQISPAVLGITVLAIGTDLPELLIAIDGGLQQLRGVDTSGLVVGNAIGSALAQCTLVLGIASWVHSDAFSLELDPRDVIALVAAFGLLAAFGANGTFSLWEGLTLLAAYGVYLALVIRSRREGSEAGVPARSAETPVLLAIGGGLLLILVSAELVVTHGMALAARWVVDDGMVGILLVGAGTSLPELVLSFGAATRGQTTLSVSNLIGSNIFDLLVPVGASALLHPVGIGGLTWAADLPITAAAHVVAFLLFRFALPRHWASSILIGTYALFALGRIAVSG